MKIPITFLGTSQAIPTAERNHIAMLLQYNSESILIDCGEGTQRQFRKAKLNPCKLTRIFITHWHGDHILGLPGLLQTLALDQYSKTLHIYGPRGTNNFMSAIMKMFVHVGKIKVKIQEISSGKVLETPDFYVQAEEMKHGAPCLAYSFIEKDKLKLDKSKIAKLKLSGFQIKDLLKRKSIEINKKTIKLSSLSHKQKGRKITFILDTRINPNTYKLAKSSDLLIAESTYTKQEEDLASRYQHLTAAQAAQIAKKSGSKALILTHISKRYDKREALVLKEAKSIFKNTTLANDLDRVEV